MRVLTLLLVAASAFFVLRGAESAACPTGCPPGCVPVTADALPAPVRAGFDALVEPTAVTGYRSAVFNEAAVYVALIAVNGGTRVLVLDAEGKPVVTVAVCPHCGGHHGEAAHAAPATSE